MYAMCTFSNALNKQVYNRKTRKFTNIQEYYI